MKNNWQTKKLGEVFIIKPPKKEAQDRLTNNDLVSFLPMEDLGILTKDVVATKERPLKEVTGSYTYFADNDILLAKITPCFENGKLGIARDLKNGIGFGSSEYIVFRSKNIIPDYLFYFLSTDQFRKEGKDRMSGAVGHKRVSKEFVENYFISFPESIDEQKRIVTLLDDIFEKIERAKKNTEKNLQNSRELFDSYLGNLNGNKESLANLVSIKTGKLNANAMEENGKYPFFTCAKEIFAINSFAFDCEAILLAGNNASGDFNVKHYKGKFNAYQRTYVINIKNEKEIMYRYLYFQLLNKLKEFKQKSVGANTKFLKLGMIQEIKIILPSFAKQKAIVKKLDELSEKTKKLEEIYKNKLADLEELKKSVLQKAFAGEL